MHKNTPKVNDADSRCRNVGYRHSLCNSCYTVMIVKLTDLQQTFKVTKTVGMSVCG